MADNYSRIMDKRKKKTRTSGKKNKTSKKTKTDKKTKRLFQNIFNLKGDEMEPTNAEMKAQQE